MATNTVEDMGRVLHELRISTEKGETELRFGVRHSNVFAGFIMGPNSEVPTDAVFLLPVSGEAPTRFMGRRQEIRWGFVQITIRGSTFEWASQTAYHIMQRLQRAQEFEEELDYLEICNTESAPILIGQDESGNHLLMTIARMVYVEESLAA